MKNYNAINIYLKIEELQLYKWDVGIYSRFFVYKNPREWKTHTSTLFSYKKSSDASATLPTKMRTSEKITGKQQNNTQREELFSSLFLNGTQLLPDRNSRCQTIPKRKLKKETNG